MKIGLDLRMIGGGSGIDRYITELSHEILKQDKTNKYVLFFRGVDKSTDYINYGHEIVIADIPHYSLAEQLKLPKILNQHNLDLVHFPHFNIPVLYRRPFVVTIHDLTHTLFPGRKKSHLLHRIAYRAIFRNAIMRSQKIIAVSNATKQAILNHFKVNPEKITTVYEGFKSIYSMMDKEAAFAKVSNSFGINKRYILYVGEWRRYKNIPALARAFDKLKGRGLDLQLVLAGKPDPYYPEIKEQVLAIKHKDDLVMPGRVTDEELYWLYNGADAFVLPSLIEGFGLPPLEAAACGTPSILSDIPALREIMGQGAEYFDPENVDNMTDVLYNLLTNPIRLEELANLALSRSKHFSWKNAGEETIKVYESDDKISNGK
jgi:glycosyltransferase involved in cell wall biosynthesis